MKASGKGRQAVDSRRKNRSMRFAVIRVILETAAISPFKKAWRETAL